MEQWYLNVPAVSKVCVKVWPLLIGEEVNELSSATTVCCVESSNFQVTVVPAETVKVIGVNMKLLISTVEPPPAAAEPLEVGVVAAAGVEGAGGLVPPPVGLEPHAVATAKTAISATKTKSGRRGRTGDVRHVSARLMSARLSLSRPDAGRQPDRASLHLSGVTVVLPADQPAAGQPPPLSSLTIAGEASPQPVTPRPGGDDARST
jgi:hypothetical protein